MFLYEHPLYIRQGFASEGLTRLIKNFTPIDRLRFRNGWFYLSFEIPKWVVLKYSFLNITPREGGDGSEAKKE